MMQKDKQLLIKDLCARLPYEVKFQGEDFNVYTLDAPNYFVFQVNEDVVFKPYLRPMSSMTDDEINEFILISDTMLWLGNNRSTCILSLEQMDWLNEHHFDYRGLISMGLALEEPEDMYKTE